MFKKIRHWLRMRKHHAMAVSRRHTLKLPVRSDTGALLYCDPTLPAETPEANHRIHLRLVSSL